MAKQKSNVDTQIPTKGMNRDVYESQIKADEYTFMLNGNFQDEHGLLILQNENSNLKCTGFKSGYKVVGHKYDINSDRIYFFLVNPTTSISEIGYISDVTSFSALSPTEDLSCDCNIKVVLESPLETVVQQSICSYITILSDYCTDPAGPTYALNFSIDHPIFENNIQIKYEKLGKVIYFTDGFNPPRYIQLTSLEENPLFYNQEVDCYGNITYSCAPLVDKMRIFKLFNKPCLTPGIIQDGGTLRAGASEATIAYCDATGNVLSNFYSFTNPILIHDKNNNILDQTNLNYLTSKSFSLDIQDLDQAYEYFKIVIIHHSGLDQAVSYYDYGVFPIDTQRVIISNLEDKQKTTLQDILASKPQYLTSEGMAESNGYLYQYGLEAHREINLQPVVNLMGAFAKWVTVQAKEDLYSDGVNASKFKSAMRDEVYPYAIKFFMEGGYESPNFVLIPRPSIGTENSTADVGNLEVASINQFVLDCEGTNRVKNWQFKNTATIDSAVCTTTAPDFGSTTVTQDQSQYCTVLDISENPAVVDTLTSGTITITTELTLTEYINENADDIKVSTDPQFTDIKDILNNPNAYTEHCTPTFSTACSTPVIDLLGSSMFAIDTATEVITESPALYADYPRVLPTETCNNILLDIDGNPTRDSVFESNYSYQFPVYKKVPTTNVNNISSKASSLLRFSEAGGSTSSVTLLNFVNSLEANLMDTTHNADANVGLNFRSTLHKSAVWFKGDFNGKSSTIVELGTLTSNTSDTFTGTSVRVSVYANSTTSSNISTYTRYITNLTLASDTNKFIELSKSNFPTSDIFYVAVDTPVITSPISKYILTLSGSTGAADIVVTTTQGADSSGISTPSGSLSQLATDFVVFNRDDVYSASGVRLEASGNQIIFWSPYASTTVTVTNTSGDLGGTVSSHIFYKTLTPPAGCLSIYQRDSLKTKEIDFTNLTFGKQELYDTTCSFAVPLLGDCDPVVSKKGKFSYWESSEMYPCNTELFDSSDLIIGTAQIPTSIKADFETYYKDSISAGTYVLKPNTNFVNQKIRHYKYPDSKLVPYMSTTDLNPGDFNNSIIYPIGFNLSREVINTFLDIAVTNNLITLKERNSITKYEIYRGDRRINKSIVAKGILFDMYQANDANGLTEFYSNYPLNTLGKDAYNNVDHPYGGKANSQFTFHSPDTHFNKPTLPKELSVEGYLFGKSSIIFDQVKDHPMYVVLGDEGYALATSLAFAEGVLESLIQSSEWLINSSVNGPYSIGSAIIAGVAIGSYVIAEAFRVGQYRIQWIKTIEGLGQLKNFAYYQTAVGHYNTFLPNTVANHTLRGISTISYLQEGFWNIAEEQSGNSFRVNNQDRENSVFISLGDGSNVINYPSIYYSYDNTQYSSTSNPTTSRRTYSGIGRSSKLVGNTAVPYATLKQYNPSQYGAINTINWLSTGFCGTLENSEENCEVVLGGDIYITRFAVKKKFPYFTTNAFGLAPLTPFKYSNYFNINGGDTTSANRFYLNYKINGTDSPTFATYIFPSDKSKYNFDAPNTRGIYVEEPSKFYLYSYGFPYFLVESEINCAYRYAKREMHENFYPNVGDIIEYTQERNVSIRENEKFFYNFVYSTTPTRSRTRMLPNNYSKATYDKLNNLKNATIYSKQGIDENSLIGSWLQYKPNDTYTFDQSYGDLIDMEGIESEQIMARFTNGVAVFGSVDTLRERLTVDTKTVGAGGIFTSRSVSYNKTELGFGGTQHKAMVSCEFGRFWADAKRGKVFNVAAGEGLVEITDGVSKWFKENLPFKLSRQFPSIDIDNTYKGIGLTMGWDDRLKRVFLTKKDYICKNNSIVLSNDRFLLGELEVFLTNSTYFTDCSWTVAYSPQTKMWVSYYSFKPSYYIGLNSYFKTGLNYSNDLSEIGLWSHLPFSSSYQVFYGKLYPFTVDYVVGTQYVNSNIESISYRMDARKYYNQWDYTDSYGIGFNKVVIYNPTQNTGDMNLVFQEKDNLRQHLQYPKFNVSSTDIVQTEINGVYSFNYLYNKIKKENSGMPIWKNDSAQVIKNIDVRLLEYRNTYLDRMRGEYFNVRLTNDKESRHKLLFRMGQEDRNFYEQ